MDIKKLVIPNNYTTESELTSRYYFRGNLLYFSGKDDLCDIIEEPIAH